MPVNDQPEAPGQARPTAVDAVVFFDELLLLAVLAVAGARLGGNLALRIALAIALPLAAAAGWGWLLAPRSSRRLANPARLAAKIGIFAAASVLLAVTGLPWWAAAFFVVSAALNVIAERSADR
jgi:Protein of unknown function (DUF2568)